MFIFFYLLLTGLQNLKPPSFAEDFTLFHEVFVANSVFHYSLRQIGGTMYPPVHVVSEKVRL